MITIIWHWFLNFTGTNNGENGFATHMYNFWSGFGGGLIQFSLLGALVAIYRHYVMHNRLAELIRKKNLLHHDPDHVAHHEAQHDEKPKE